MNNHGNKGNTGKTETKHRKQNRTTHDSMPTEDEGGRVEEDVEQAKGKKATGRQSGHKHVHFLLARQAAPLALH